MKKCSSSVGKCGPENHGRLCQLGNFPMLYLLLLLFYKDKGV